MASSITETLNTATAALHLNVQAQEHVKPKPKPSGWFGEHAKPGDVYPYARYLPTFDGDLKLPPLQDFTHIDPGHQALEHADPLAFLAGEGVQVEELTPQFGSEVSGLQLDKLDDRGRQQLALFVAKRGVVAFRDQDLIDQDPEWLIKNWTAFFGRPHIHPTSGAPASYPELHLVHREPKSSSNYELINRLSSTAWHSDVTYERQPPSLTALFLFDSPASGGDTGYADQRLAYEHLSPKFREYLETLQVVHSGVAQAEYSRKGLRGGIVKREPVENIHPLVRRHPVTGEKALFVNRQFSRSIVGLKIEESDAILELLYNHIQRGVDFQTRIRWKPRTVVLWDNRITAHTAILDFAKTSARRHGARLTPQAEKPFL